MVSFEITSVVVIVAIVCLGMILGALLQSVWLMRIVLAGYIALCLVLLLPSQYAFNVYANFIFFVIFCTLFVFLGRGYFFSVSGFGVGRLSIQTFLLGICVCAFIVTVICYLLPLNTLMPFMTKDLYVFFTEYVFYFAVAPVLLVVVFSRYLR